MPPLGLNKVRRDSAKNQAAHGRARRRYCVKGTKKKGGGGGRKPVTLWMIKKKLLHPWDMIKYSTVQVGQGDYFICYPIYPIHIGPRINKVGLQLRLINKPPDLNQTDDLAADSHQRHYRWIIQSHYFTSFLNVSHSDIFMKVARFKSINYAWTRHHSVHNE